MITVPYDGMLGPRIEDEETSIHGLTFIPSLGVGVDHKDSIVNVPEHEVAHGYTQCVTDVIIGEIERLGDDLQCIVEIGVHQFSKPPPMDSLTQTLIKHKLPETIYVGVDQNPKTHLDDESNGVYTIAVDSSDTAKVFSFLDTLSIEKIDLLHIDGYHSVNQVVDDWRYTERLAEHGVVIMHDVNYHPGPWAVFEAIDTNLYHKEKFCPGNDFGSAVIRRI